MKLLSALDFGYSDAENYKLRQNKALFNRVFFRNEPLERLCQDTTYFLVGDKGTGKTAYAVYLANNEFLNISASLAYIRETEYQKFLELKRQNQLQLSDYTSIWRTILLLMIAKKIYEDEPKGTLYVKRKCFSHIQDAINEFYQNAFSPEIFVALQFTDESALFAKVINEHLRAGGEENVVLFTPARFQANLRYIEEKLRTAIAAVKTSKRHTLFIDGIDIRPATVPYDDYRECIAGLANAVWAINNDVFGTIKDPGGQCRVVLLIRPDILESLGLQNTNTKIRDNAVVLDWRTTYPQYRGSDIFCAIDRLLSAQQDHQCEPGECWDHYFPFDAPTDTKVDGKPSSFISFLRFSLFRPRDIVVMMDILGELKRSEEDDSPISLIDFNSPEFRKRYAVYLLGEVKDQVSFYHTKPEYEAFLKFFEFLRGKTQFNYQAFSDAYLLLMKHLQSIRMDPPDFFESANRFLQYLFDLNIVSYKERMQDGTSHIHWCFRERSYANINPKVKSDVDYEIHYGLAKALNLGKQIG